MRFKTFLNRKLIASVGALVILLSPALVGRVYGQSTAPPSAALTAKRDRLVKESDAAFEKDDFVAAEGILRKLIEIDGDNFVPYYNLCCALCCQDRTQDAGPMLEKAIQLGFTDLQQLQTDPHLAALRRTENYKRLVARWGEILGARIESDFDAIKKRYGASYTYEKDEKLRLAYASAFAPSSFEQAKKELARLSEWWATEVAPDPPPDPPSGTGDKKGGDPPAAPWVLIVLPTRPDYAKWAIGRFGPAWEHIGGSYMHDDKSLVAQDLGATLRHEFWHSLHWRHMDQLGQRHPIWVMEGLCSLVEDVNAGAKGEMQPVASWRTNMAGRLARSGNLMPWDRLFKMNHKNFVQNRPLANYGQARSIFLYLSELGKLKVWYAALIQSFPEDPTGRKAFEVVFNKPAKQVEADFRTWLRALPEVAEDFKIGSAVFPFEVDNSTGEGVVIKSFIPKPSVGQPDTTGGLRMKDVITSVNGQNVREMAELVRILAEYQPGAQVEVEYRRARTTGKASITLVPAK